MKQIMKQSNGEASVVSKASINEFFKENVIFFKIMVTILVFTLFTMSKVSTDITISPGAKNENYVKESVGLIKEDYSESIKIRMNRELIREVDSYITRMAPTSKLRGKNLVFICEKYDLDIVFVMAQALIESHFGTRGKAVETNSVWNVGTYDNGVIKYRYPTANASIEPYAKLLHDKYLLLGDSIEVNDKNVLHLLQDKGYINYDGKRFASAKGYENALRKLMVKIDMETSIGMYQNVRELNTEEMVALFAPLKEDNNNALN